MKQTEFKAKAKAFTGERSKMNRFLIDENGALWVYDSIAKHFTTCHALTPAELHRLKKQQIKGGIKT